MPDPGWTRVDANSTVSTLLASAWVSPGGDAITVVLVNNGTSDQGVELDFVNGEHMVHSAVSRTAFEGIERGAALGSLSQNSVLEIPAHAMVTVAFSN